MFEAEQKSNREGCPDCFAAASNGGAARSHHPSQQAFADYTVTQIRQRFRNIVVALHEGIIVILFGEVKMNAVTNGIRPENNHLVKWLVSYFEHYEIVIGVSDYFTDMRELHLHYRRALRTAKLVDRLGLSYGLFNDLMPMPMLAAVLESETAETFLHPVLQRIWDYDQENKTDFFRSVYLCIEGL